MTNHYAKIRAALEYAQCQRPHPTPVVERAFAALAELERDPLYAAPPIPKGMFTPREMEAAYMNGHQDRNLCNSIAVFDWINSTTYKLIQDRAK